MFKHPELTERRIERFIRNEIAPLLWARSLPMRAEVYRPDGPWPRESDPLEPAPNPLPADAAFAPVQPGYTWGPIWSDAWFRFVGAVPKEWQGQAVVARIDVGAEAIVWDGSEPLQGIDGNHAEFLVTRDAAGGDAVTLTVRANGMNPNVSWDGRPVAPPAEPFRFALADLALLDVDLWGLYNDLRIAFQVMREMPRNEPRFGQLLYALNEVVNTWDAGRPETLQACRDTVGAVLNRPAAASAHALSAIGHAHIDTAWLWPLERTQQKCLHTFATATRYMDLYPEYVFVCSQAVQYDWVKRMAPALYERIKAKAASGQWEIAGSMWVEADCNITGGESLVRQILLAKNFWMDEFGYETVDLWLPDVFGYSAALPQILRKSGVDYFMTQKISWNQVNKFPHHTFLWQGIDGTRVFTHFPPADTYNASMTPRELVFNVRNFRDHDRATRSLYVYGFGDGGGGPTVEMLENARRLANTEGMPTITMEKSRTFFEKAEADARDLPVWAGELYLELHRGTYTTQARNKKGNRRSEFLLRDAEFISVVQPAGLGAYRAAEIDRAWKLVLLNQFHDIIPGSSVHEVYVDSDRDYAEVERLAEGVIRAGIDAIADRVDTSGLQCPVLVVRNNDDFAYKQPVQVLLPDGVHPASVQYADEQPAPVQVIAEDGQRFALFEEQTTEEGHGYTTYDLSAVPCEEVNTFIVTQRLLDNGLLRVEFDADGLITRIYDNMRAREVLNPGERANQLQLFEDRPLDWDAWDVDAFYQEKMALLTEVDSVEVLEEGPVRGAIRFTRSFGSSRLRQTVRLWRDSARVEFFTEVDWHESRRMLKAAFPVAINAARATFEIQFGHVERPTHYNTSWDVARFEVAAQKWADLSEGDYGVALLNDCKYGHDVHGNVLRLTLLRSPKAPDPEADMGAHTFTYAIVPHYGDFRRGSVVEQAYALNGPVHARLLPANRPGPMPPEQAYFRVDREGIIIEAVKKAEKEDAVIVRLYEAHNERGPATLFTSLPVRSAHLCDLLERDEAELPVAEGAVQLTFAPFEIVTVKLRP